MADTVQVINASGLVYTGKGVITGILVSVGGVGAPRVTLYDDTKIPSTAIIFYGSVSPYNHLIKFFDDAHSIRFNTGIFLAMSAACSVTLWTRQF